MNQSDVNNFKRPTPEDKMDRAVTALLAMHDDQRTEGRKPWPPTWAMYGRMWEERDEAVVENRRLRGLLARALPWIDPNDSHEDYLLTVEIREALGEGT